MHIIKHILHCTLIALLSCAGSEANPVEVFGNFEGYHAR